LLPIYRNKGLTLIETLVSIGIFVVVALATYKAFGVLMDTVSVARAKVAATEVADGQFEIIRNLPYDDVGIINGLPAGKVQKTQTITADSYSFNLTTTIRSIDDPFDGTINGTPSDTSPADYKLVALNIACPNCKAFAPLKFVTLIAPQGLETASTNGALFVQVFDVNGSPIQSASVHIVNNQTSPSTIIDDTTDDNGLLKIVDAPPGTNAYNITVSKTGYSQDQTYPLNGAAGPNPVNSDATVVIQKVTQASLSIDRTSTLSVSTVDSTCTAVPNIGFSMTGQKVIGTNPSVLKYPTQDFNTDSSGNYDFSRLEWDTYSTLLTSNTYDLEGTSLLSVFSIAPAENKNMQMIVTPHVNNALLVSIIDTNNNPVDGALVVLQKTPFSDTKTTNTGACPTPGQIFWNGLSSGSYTATVSKNGYETSVVNVDISLGWQNKVIILAPAS
jgi:prepilin-type N-terminal cleavage/methylation domain-containing protein